MGTMILGRTIQGDIKYRDKYYLIGAMGITPAYIFNMVPAPIIIRPDRYEIT